MTAVNLNRAIRGPVTAVPIVAGKGVRLVADTENNRWVVESDETVLYSNDAPEQIISATTLALSESYLNFERIRIYLGCSAGSTSNTLYSVECLVSGSQYATELSTHPVCISGGGLQCDCNSFLFNSSNPTQCSVGAYGKRINVTAAGAFSSTNGRGAYVFKIVGINRIASN